MAEGIKLVVFDMEEVITDTWNRLLPGAVPELNSFSAEYLKENLYGRGTPERLDFFEGRITEEEFWEKKIALLKLGTSVEGLKAAVRKAIAVELPGVLGIVRGLRGRYKTALNSNFPKEWFEYVRGELNFDEFFDAYFVSGYMGVSKPDERAYSVMLRQFGIKPGECLFIDDKARNTDAAKKLGINVIVFRDSGQLREDMEKILGA